MHEDDDYNDEHDYDDAQDKYKHYFKFDPDAWDAWGKMLYNALNDVVEGSSNVWYVNLWLLVVVKNFRSSVARVLRRKDAPSTTGKQDQT